MRVVGAWLLVLGFDLWIEDPSSDVRCVHGVGLDPTSCWCVVISIVQNVLNFTFLIDSFT